MKNILLIIALASASSAQALEVEYIDIIDSPVNSKISYVVVGYDNGVVDRLEVPREKFNDGKNTKDITSAAMKMINARTGRK